MRKRLGMNRHQKAAHKKGEARVGKEQVAELLLLSTSDDPDDRLAAAENLCPCHVRTRIPAVWEALFRMMEDADPRVRRAAWHTIEDGGKPSDEESLVRLEAILSRELDPKVRKFAEFAIKKAVGPRTDRDLAALWMAGRPEVKQRGKCDFCGETGVPISIEPATLIPAGNDYRAALICERCAKAA